MNVERDNERISRMTLVAFNMRVKGALSDLEDVRGFMESKTTLEQIGLLDQLSTIRRTLSLIQSMNEALLDKTAIRKEL